MSYKNLKIGIKLSIAFSGLIVMTLIIGIIAFISMNKMKKLQDDIAKITIPSITSLQELEYTHAQLKAMELGLINSNLSEKSLRASFYNKEVNIWQKVDKALAVYEPLALTDEEIKTWKQFTKEWQQWKSDHQQIIILEKKKDNLLESGISTDDQAIKEIDKNALDIYDSARQSYDAANTSLEKLADMNVEEGNGDLKEADTTSSNGIHFLILILFIIIIFSIIVSVFITRIITIPILQGVDFAKQISHGDMSATIQIDRKDEIGELAIALSEMAGKVKDVIIQLRHGIETILSASLQMSSASQQISQGASEQASSTEEISSSMEQMASNIMQNAENAQHTEKIANTTAQNAEIVASSAKESLTSITDIASKTSIINDIAFQTNILALNAAVEAARAGENGKGFAVVAAEVRKLAERSKIASDEIGALTRSSVKVTEEAKSLMMGIIPNVEKTSKLVQEITAASMEQNSGADQINSAIQQLNTITQQNAAASEEMATSAEELANQANQLKELVAFFNIEEHSIKSKVKN